MIYNHMPDWIYASKDITSTSKLLMERIFSLSKEGTQEVYIKRAFLAETLGVSERTLSRCFQELMQLGLIEESTNSNSCDKCKKIIVTKKACSDSPYSVFKNELISNDETSSKAGQNVHIDNDKMFKKAGQNVQKSMTKCPEKHDKMSRKAGQNVLSSLDRSIGRIKGRIKGRYIYISDEAKNSHEKVKNSIEYPQSPEECEAYFLAYIKKYQDERPILQNFPLRMEAEKFFTYWGIEKNWKRGRTAIKSVAGCVATWCGNWIDRNQNKFATRSLKQDIDAYKAYGDDFENFVNSRTGDDKTTLKLEDFEVIAG